MRKSALFSQHLGRNRKPQQASLLPYFFILLWAVACFVFFQYFYRHHLAYQEQNQIFLLTTGYARSYFQMPAWLSCLAGDFITQFYYYLYAGPALLTLTLLTAGDLVRRSWQACGLRRGAFVVAFVAMTLLAVLSFRHDYRLASIISVIGGAAAFLTLKFLSGRNIAIDILLYALAAAATYWLFGYGVYILLIFMLLDAIFNQHKKDTTSYTKRLAPTLFALLTALILPPILSRNCYHLPAKVAYTYPGLGRFSMPNFELEKQFAIADDYFFGDEVAVIKRVETEKNPSELYKYFYNLVMAKRGQLPDVLLKFQPNNLGTFYSIGPETPRLIISNMHELYWTLGDMTFAERAAMMANVFSPQNRNVRMMKRLAEVNLVTADSAAAEKYLRILEHTLAYKKTAQRMRQSGPVYAQKRALTNAQDTLRVTDNLHLVMMELLDSHPNNAVALDYLLCSDLLLKDIANFKRDFDRYGQALHRPLHALYQQALCIYLAGTNAPQADWQQYVTSPDVLKQFMQYNQYRGSQAFKNTYWYYFDTAKTPER